MTATTPGLPRRRCPPATGPLPDDGAFDVSVDRIDGDPGRLVATIRRWVRCSDGPDLCTTPHDTIDIGSDPDDEVVRLLDLDGDLTVVLNGIPTEEGGTWRMHRIEGNGFAFAVLLYRLDAVFEHVVVPAFEAVSDPWEAESGLGATGAGDELFPFGPSAEAIVAYRGPAGALFTTWAYYSLWTGDATGIGIWGWWATLEIVDGRPVLYLDAGQIAG